MLVTMFFGCDRIDRICCAGFVFFIWVIYAVFFQGEFLSVGGDGDDILHIVQVHILFAEIFRVNLRAILCTVVEGAVTADQSRIGYFAGIRDEAVISCQVEYEDGKEQKRQHDRCNDLLRPVEEGAEIIFVDDLHDAGSDDCKQQHPDDRDDESAAGPDRTDEKPCKKPYHQRHGDADHGLHRVEDDRTSCPLVPAQTAADPGEEEKEDGQSQ